MKDKKDKKNTIDNDLGQKHHGLKVQKKKCPSGFDKKTGKTRH